jgi:hypothetical protein
MLGQAQHDETLEDKVKKGIGDVDKQIRHDLLAVSRARSAAQKRAAAAALHNKLKAEFRQVSSCCCPLLCCCCPLLPLLASQQA